MFLYQFAQFSHRLFPSWWDKYENVCVFESLYLPRVMVASVTPNKRGHTDLCRFGGEIYLLRIDSGKKLHCNILWFLCFHTVLCVVTVNITTSQPRALWPLVQYFYKPNSFSNSISFPWQLKVVTKSLFCVFFEKITSLKWICLSLYPRRSIYLHNVFLLRWCNDW